MPKSPHTIEDLQSEAAFCASQPHTLSNERELEDLMLLIGARTHEPVTPEQRKALLNAANRQSQRRFRRRNDLPVGVGSSRYGQGQRKRATHIVVGMSVIAPDGREGKVLAPGPKGRVPGKRNTYTWQVSFADGTAANVFETDLLVPEETAGVDTERLLRASVAIEACRAHLAALDAFIADAGTEVAWRTARAALDAALADV